MPFSIIKIRSIKLNAATEGAQWCTLDNPRRLRVGAFMRKWNIDKVPQFWNVLKGGMSLFGPRPDSLNSLPTSSMISRITMPGIKPSPA